MPSTLRNCWVLYSVNGMMVPVPGGRNQEQGDICLLHLGALGNTDAYLVVMNDYTTHSGTIKLTARENVPYILTATLSE